MSLGVIVPYYAVPWLIEATIGCFEKIDAKKTWKNMEILIRLSKQNRLM